MTEVSEGPIAAPGFEGATDWLNVAAPISIAQLRGKVVLIDFWTYGCVNCMHVLRDLRILEERFPDELVVVGVHSPKFTNERSSDNLKRILVRYEIEHPVANDANHVIWRRYGVQAWPTRVIVDPMGNLVGTAMGEGNLDGFADAIRGVIRVFDERGEINRSRLPLDLERGVFGSLMSTPIVNAPQSAILGMHKIEERPVAVDGQVVVRPMMYVALTYDHRIIDGRDAVQFLVAVKEALEDPARLLLQV